jgi:hypothetical protein
MSIRQAIAVSLTIAVALMALLVPLYVNVRLTNDGPEQVTTSTLFETVGPSGFVPLLIPVALTGLPLLLTGRAQRYASVATTVALAIFSVIASATIGWFYVPALAAAIASVMARPETHTKQKQVAATQAGPGG